MVQLPDDIVRDILSFLPVRSLLRSRCVSKQFYALIDSPCFIKQHLKNHSGIGAKTNQIILRGGGNNLYLFNMQNAATDEALINNTIKRYYRTLGTVNGLLCLSDFDHEAIVFWNLATRNYHKLPLRPYGFSSPPDTQAINCLVTSGFGYDSVSDDYKLLSISRFSVSSHGVNYVFVRAQAYSLRSNSWEMLQDFPDNILIRPGRCAAFVCGALHWMALLPHSIHIFAFSYIREMCNQIAAFDIASNKCTIVTKPDIHDDNTCHMSVGELGGCLSLTCNYTGDRVDVWVMKDYGVKESWSKQFSVPQRKEVSPNRVLSPLAYSESRDEILLVIQNKYLVWYNPDTKKVGVIYEGDQFEAWVCGESMVPLSTKYED